MLKRQQEKINEALLVPAAFRRLCVETSPVTDLDVMKNPAAFRRLCVETRPNCLQWAFPLPAAFRRLCVETTTVYVEFPFARTSRLQAAVC